MPADTPKESLCGKGGGDNLPDGNVRCPEQAEDLADHFASELILANNEVNLTTHQGISKGLMFGQMVAEKESDQQVYYEYWQDTQEGMQGVAAHYEIHDVVIHDKCLGMVQPHSPQLGQSAMLDDPACYSPSDEKKEVLEAPVNQEVFDLVKWIGSNDELANKLGLGLGDTLVIKAGEEVYEKVVDEPGYDKVPCTQSPQQSTCKAGKKRTLVEALPSVVQNFDPPDQNHGVSKEDALVEEGEGDPSDVIIRHKGRAVGVACSTTTNGKVIGAILLMKDSWVRESLQIPYDCRQEFDLWTPSGFVRDDTLVSGLQIDVTELPYSAKKRKVNQKGLRRY